MKSQIHPFTIALLLASLALVAGCTATGPSDAALSGDPAAMLEYGQKAVARGEKLVKSGDERLVEGREQVRDGEELIDQGNRDMLEAQDDYREAVSITGRAAAPDDLADEAKRLKNIGDRWEDAIEAIRDGNNLVASGNKSIDRAQSEIREGRTLMEAGSTMIRDAQRVQMSDELLPQPR